MRKALIAAACLFLLTGSCSAASLLRVGVLCVPKPDTVRVSCAASLRVTGIANRAVIIRPNDILTASAKSNGLQISVGQAARKCVSSVILEGTGGCPVRLTSTGVNSRFRGRLRLSCRSEVLRIVNEVTLEDYVRGVVANEMRHDWPIEALKAQAVASRTLAVGRMGEHHREGFDLCDTTHCQVYRGAGSETSSTDLAIRATVSQILTWRDAPIQALYCSCCGGFTASAYASKSLGDTPYLKARKDALNGNYACSKSPHFDWDFKVSSRELADALRSDSRTTPGSRFSSIVLIRKDISGRAVFVEVQGERTKEVDAYILWNVLCRKLGWGSVKSIRCRLTTSSGGYEFKGHGLGHGIGMCQWGANGRAKSGWGYQRILAFYYNGAGLKRASVEKTVDNP